MLYKNKSRFCLITAVLLLLTVILGRSVSFFQSVSATDIAYAGWVSTLMAYISEILTAIRTAVSFTAMSYAAYRLDRSAVVSAAAFSALAALFDYAARFVIDLVSGSLSGMEFLAVIWLLLQLLYEWIFLALALLIILMMKKKAASAESSFTAEKYSSVRAVRASLFLVLLSHTALEAYYLVDFILTYSDITNTEIASIIGQFLKIIVIYGGAALLAAEGIHALFERVTETNQETDT